MTKAAFVLLLISVLLAACHPVDREIEAVAIDPAELEAWLDQFFPAQMEKLRIPGVSFVLVQNGEIVLAKGYGSSLNLLPEHDAGYFFSFNEECYLTSACEIISAFREQLVNQFFSN